MIRTYHAWTDDLYLEGLTVCYGDYDWPSYSRWVVPGTWLENN